MRRSKNKPMLNDFGILSNEVATFKLVYEQKSINGAARQIGQDPGNISRLITKLETTLKGSLFVRHKTGLRPTDMGTRFYLAVNSAQLEFSQKLNMSSIQSRPIRIGFSQAIGHSYFSPSILSSLLNLNLTPQFTIDSSTSLVEQIKTRDLDLIIVHNAFKFPSLISKSITAESLVLVSLTGQEQKILILHPDMLSLEKIVQSMNYENRWMMRDYFVIARTLQRNKSLMGILPESLLETYQDLKIIKKFANEGKITALTWPGSVGGELLESIK